MRSLAKKLETEAAPEQVAGWVVDAAGPGGAFVVRSGAVEHGAKRAASCLLEPAVGDRVLAVVLGDGSAWVLAVLERTGDAKAATLSLDGDVALRLASGRLDVVTAGGVGVASSGDVGIVAPAVDVRAVDGRLGIERLAVAGKHLLAEIASVKAVAGVIDGVADRISQRVKRAYRFVEELDRLRAKRLDYHTEKTMQLHGENALMTAEKLVKLDGEHIHMG